MANAVQDLLLRIGGDSTGGQQAARDLANALSNTLVKALMAAGDQSATAAKAVGENAAALDKATAATGGWIPLLHELGTSWVARIAEGQLLRDAVHEVIGKLKEMAEFLPEIALQGSKVAGVEKNFDRLTESAGLTASTLMGTLRSATRDTITDFDLMKRVNQDLAAGLNLTEAQFGTLAKGAYALAKATGVDEKAAFDTMNDAMLTGRTRSLALLTGKISQTAAEEAYAKTLFSTAEHLTEEGKLEGSREAILKAVTAATERLGEQTAGLGTRVTQAHVAWANFEEDLGKTIASSPVLKAGLDGIHDGLVAAFGGSQQALIEAIAQKVETLELVIVELARGGVTAAGFLATEWYALQKVFGDVAQIIQGNALAFEYLALGAAKATAAVNLTSEGQRKAAADVERIQGNITSLLVTMKARGDALQAADAAQQGVDAGTAKYTALLDGVIVKMQAARDGASTFVGPLEAVADAHEKGAAGADHQAAMLQASKHELSEAAQAAKELAAAQKEALDAAIPLTVAQQAETSGLLALGVSYKSIAKDIGAAEIQVKLFADTQKKAAADEQEAQTKALDLEIHLHEEVMKLSAKQAEADKKHRDEINAGRDKAIVDSLADIKKMQEAQEDADLSVVDAHVRAIERKRDADIQAVQNSLLLEGHLKDERIRLIKETADREISELDRVTNWWKGGVEHQMMPPGLSSSVSSVTTEVQRLQDAFAKLGQTIGGTFGALLTGASQIASLFSAYEKAQQAYALNPTPQNQQALQQAGSNRAWGTAAIGMSLVAQNINTGAGASTGNLIASGALQGGAAGTAVMPGWGTAIGAGVGAAVGWYQSGQEWRKAFNDVARDFGNLKIPEDFAKTIEQIESDTGLHRVQALTTQLDQLIKIAGGLNANNFTLFFSKLHDAFSYIEQGTLSVAQVTQILDKNFADFAKAGTDAYGRINDQVRELIDLDQRFGTQSQAIADWMKGQAAAIATGLNDLLAQPMIASVRTVGQAVIDAQKALDDLKASGTATADALTQAQNALTAAITTQHQEATRNKQALADLATTAVTAFNAAIASGSTFLQALQAISPALSTIQQAYKDLGVDIEDATVKGLALENTILNGTADAPSGLGKAISGLQAIVTASINLGKAVETPVAFEAQQRNLASLFTAAQAASAAQGVTGDAGTAAALLPLQQTLHELQDWAKKNGLELSADTQEKIRMSQDLGVWNDDFKTDGQKTRDSIADLIASNERLAAVIGGHPYVPPPVAPPPVWVPPPPTTGPGAGPPENTPGAAIPWPDATMTAVGTQMQRQMQNQSLGRALVQSPSTTIRSSDVGAFARSTSTTTDGQTTSGGGGDGHLYVNLQLDGQAVAKAVVKNFRRNPDGIGSKARDALGLPVTTWTTR